MSGTFVNVVDAIDNPKTATPGDSSSLTKKEPIVVSIPKVATREGVRMARLGSAVQFMSPVPLAWTVYDMNGNKVADAFGQEFLWSGAVKGVYMVTARGNGIRYTRKVFIR